MKRHGTQLIVGLFLVIAGVLTLLRNTNVWTYDSRLVWAAFMVVGGLIVAGGGIGAHKNARPLLGAFVCFYGVFLLLRAFDLLATFPHLKAIAALASLAMAFLFLFILEPRNLGNLVGACVVGAVALLIYFSVTNEMLADDLHDFLRVYWPVALILLGVSSLIRRR